MSPSDYNNRTLRYKDEIYGHIMNEYRSLSRSIHADESDARQQIENQVKELIYIPENVYIHLVFEHFHTWEDCVSYCKEMKCPLPKKEAFNRIRKLVHRWQSLSKDYHYQPTKQEKRRLKKQVVKE